MMTPLELDPAPSVTRLYDAATTRALDAYAIDVLGIPGIVLMRRAGGAAFDVLRASWPEARGISVLCGRGNNAGDGYVIAGLGRSRGLEVQLLQIGDAAELRGDAALARDWALGEGVVIETFEPGCAIRGEVVVDALLGTGVEGPARPAFAAAIDAINAVAVPVLAVDLPSGLSADTGVAAGAVVQADVTVSFIAAKRGAFTGEGPACCGRRLFDDLGLPADLAGAAQASGGVPLLRLGEDDLWLPARPRTAHKGAFGHVLVVGGDEGMGGAVCLAAEAALRCGAGLVSLATRPAHVAPVLARTPEVMVRGVADRHELLDMLDRASVVVVGPGLGRAPWGELMLHTVLDSGLPLVVDADGLNLLAGLDVQPREDWILTPHPGEAARLLDTDTRAIADDRFAALAALRERFGGVVLLKGAGTLIGAADGTSVCRYGNPGMASGGMGDVLAGMLGALRAQGLAPPRATRLGVCLHGAAADLAALSGEASLVASDLLGELPALLSAVTR